MGVAVTSPLTIEEFDRLTLPDDRIWELHDGELVEMTFPAWIHREIQARLVELLMLIFPNAKVMKEMPFQFGVRTKRSADVGITSLARSAAAAREGILVGTPEMVIEVISPSNSFSDVMKFKRTCEENDTQVFWVVDPYTRTVAVSRGKGEGLDTYGIGEQAPIRLFDVTSHLEVQRIFEGIV